MYSSKSQFHISSFFLGALSLPSLQIGPHRVSLLTYFAPCRKIYSFLPQTPFSLSDIRTGKKYPISSDDKEGEGRSQNILLISRTIFETDTAGNFETSPTWNRNFCATRWQSVRWQLEWNGMAKWRRYIVDHRSNRFVPFFSSPTPSEIAVVRSQIICTFHIFFHAVQQRW